MKNKFGFTLAEVLITLVIIGIVAALTISPIINTYIERSTISKVKKGLSTLAQAKKLAEAQNGSIMGWDFEGRDTAEDTNKFWSYIKPHMSVVKECAYGSNPADCDIGLKFGLRTSNSYSFWGYYKFVLADGGVMWYRVNGGGKCSSAVGGIDNACIVFFYDTNGNKAPNTIGRDVFRYIMNIDGVYPDITNCDNDGWGCTGYIIKNDNMNYLH